MPAKTYNRNCGHATKKVSNWKKKLRQAKPYIILCSMPLIGLVIGVLFTMAVMGLRSRNARNDYGRELRYAVYEVQPGDTMWGIATDMAAINPEFTDVRQYLRLLQQTNKTYGGETLQAGTILYLPYYAAPDGDSGLERNILSIYLKYDIGTSKWIDLIQNEK